MTAIAAISARIKNKEVGFTFNVLKVASVKRRVDDLVTMGFGSSEQDALLIEELLADLQEVIVESDTDILMSIRRVFWRSKK
ncbi:hypothetical protein KA012_04270 [Candidatus Woesebacteria bacterium]|nr:hypothetical protein [Candidatus Woesebacteria bacterium]